MNRSKLFSGDLPEITNLILLNLRNDLKSLHSCILVNRLFCRIAIPLLWKDPFSKNISSNKSILYVFDIYFFYLNDDDKNLLKENGIDRIYSQSLKIPLFNYPSYIKVLNSDQMDLHLMVWIDNFTSFYMGDKYSDIQIFEYIRGCEIKYPSTEVEFKVKTVLKIFTLREILFNRTKSNPDLMQKLNLISFLLFKTFIKYDASLHKLHLNIKFSYPNQHMSEFYELILNNQNFFSKLKYFTLGLEKNNIVTQEYLEQSILFQHFLSHLPKICTSIKYLELNIPYDIYIQLLKEIKNLFKSQKDLLKIQSVYGGKKNNLTEYLPFCSNTLTTINFYTIFFSNEISFNGLERLTHIKCLEFQHCVGPELFIQSLLNVLIPLKIKTLLLEYNIIINIIPFQLLIHKIGSYLEFLTIIYQPYFIEEFFESIIQNCERIKFFHLTAIEHSHIPQLFRLITLLNDHLKYLTLEDFTKEELRFGNFYTRYSHESNVSSIILNEMGQLLPNNLSYLDLNLEFEPKELETFFENCKHVNFRRLSFRNYNKNSINTTLEVIKEFVKKKGLECLAYEIDVCDLYLSSLPCDCLEVLTQEIKQFVTMKDYKDWVIKPSLLDGTLN